MHLPDFDYFAPGSLAEASELLTKYKDSVKVLGGGTDLLPKMKHGVIAPKVMVSIKDIPNLKEIKEVPGKGVLIGTLATLNDMVFSELLNKKYNSISNAAASMAANQIRHIGTLGGNIVSSVPSADTPPILIALGAQALIAGPNGDRSMPLENLFVGPGKTLMEQNEIFTGVIIPDNKFTGSTYHKFALRRSGALATVGVAVAVQMEGDTIKDARVCFGAVAPVPMRAVKVEEFIKGKKLTDELLEEAGAIAYSECKPITDFRASEEYRRDLVRVYTKRTLKKAAKGGHN